MRTQLIDSHDPRWPAIVAEAQHDFYHLAGYARLSARTGESAVALLVQDEGSLFFLPLIARPIPGFESQWDAVSPYGYAGPLVRSKQTPNEFISRASAAAIQELRRAGCVSLFVRFHPLLNVNTAGFESMGALVRHGETVVVDLSRDLDTLWRDTRSGHRTEISRSMRAGHRAYIDIEWGNFSEFLRIYRETMARVGAAPSYFFSDEYFSQLRDELRGRLHLAVVEVEGNLAAAALISEMNGIFQYHLSGTATGFLRQQPTKLLLHHVRLWARERRGKWLHLGGGVGGSADSLFRFKAGFSSGRLPFCSWRVVVSPEEYSKISLANGVEHCADQTAFFPAYRQNQ